MTTRSRLNRIRSLLAREPSRPGRRTSVANRSRSIEVLEDRQLLATFVVTDLNDSGAGSLRRAIMAPNATPGADAIDFAVDGTIRVGKNSLPAITPPLTIDGTSAPGFAGTSAVTLDFRGTRGLRFNRGRTGRP